MATSLLQDLMGKSIEIVKIVFILPGFFSNMEIISTDHSLASLKLVKL